MNYFFVSNGKIKHTFYVTVIYICEKHFWNRCVQTMFPLRLAFIVGFYDHFARFAQSIIKFTDIHLKSMNTLTFPCIVTSSLVKRVQKETATNLHTRGVRFSCLRKSLNSFWIPFVTNFRFLLNHSYVIHHN